MKALMRLSEKAYHMDLTEVEDPVLPEDNWVKVKIAYSGICGGSDIKFMRADLIPGSSKLKPPVILGHEASGTVIETKSKISRGAVGQKVTVDTVIDPCGMCEYCRSGKPDMCRNRKSLGSDFNGSFAEYLVCPETNIHPLPKNVSLRLGVLAEPMACGVHIVYDMARIRQNEKVIIIGPGTIGLCCAVAALDAGAEVVVIGTENGKERLQTAQKLGCNTIVNQDIDKIEKIWKEQTADVVIDAVGSNRAVDQGLGLLKRGGRLVIGGVPFTDKQKYLVDIDLLYRNQLQILAGRSSHPYNWDIALHLLEKYSAKIEKLITEIFPMEQWKEGFMAARDKKVIKALIRFDQGEE